jgi:hypothetical protein
MMRRRLPLIVLVAMLIGSSISPVTAQEATPGASAEGGSSLLAGLGYPEIRVTSDGTTHDFPTELAAGRYHIVLENKGETGVDLEFWRLPDGITLEEVTAFFEEANQSEEFLLPDFFYDMIFNGGPSTSPGQTASVVLDLAPGEWVVNHYVYDPESDESNDSPSIVTVTGEMPVLEEPPVDVDVTVIEMDFVAPDTIAAGPQIWRVSSRGLQIHHMVLSRVPDGTTEDQVMELAASFMGPPPAADATPDANALSFEDVEDIFDTLLFSFNQFNLYEIDLEPGTYVMICFMPDPSGTPHVMLGMVEIITVG